MPQDTLPAENTQIIRFPRHEQEDSYEDDAAVAEVAEEILEKHHAAFAELAK